ncbi:MAG TPA: IclR family transcriptional regulator [Enteractinococcus sp.]
MANSSRGESVVQRVSRILRVFDEDHQVLSATQVAQRADLAISTAHRMVGAMVDEGLLLRTPEGKYRLGLILWELAHRSTVYQNFSAAARPFLEGVHQTLKKTVSLAILDPAEVSIIYLERLAIGHDDTDVSSLAGRLPVLSTAPGQVMLAFAPRHIQEQYFDQADQDPGVISQRLTRQDLEARLAQVKREGWAHVAEVLSAGSSGTAAPVFGRRQRVIGAISVVRPVDEINMNVQLPVLLAAARGLSQVMAQQPEHHQDFAQW